MWLKTSHSNTFRDLLSHISRRRQTNTRGGPNIVCLHAPYTSGNYLKQTLTWIIHQFEVNIDLTQPPNWGSHLIDAATYSTKPPTWRTDRLASRSHPLDFASYLTHLPTWRSHPLGATIVDTDSRCLAVVIVKLIWRSLIASVEVFQLIRCSWVMTSSYYQDLDGYCKSRWPSLHHHFKGYRIDSIGRSEEMCVFLLIQFFMFMIYNL